MTHVKRLILAAGIAIAFTTGSLGLLTERASLLAASPAQAGYLDSAKKYLKLFGGSAKKSGQKARGKTSFKPKKRYDYLSVIPKISKKALRNW